MSVYDNMIKVRDTARIAKDKPVLEAMQLIIGEVDRKIDKAARGDDTGIFQLLKSHLKNWQAEYEIHPTEKLKVEIDVIKLFIPLDASKEELIALYDEIKPVNIGMFMKAAKEKYGSAFDGKTAKEIFEGKQQ